jgi:hypothetical protein
MRQLTEAHSYEELRAIVVDLLLRPESIANYTGQYGNLVDGVAGALARRGAIYTDISHTSAGLRMNSKDVELVRDIFWDLFRQGMITLGRDESNQNWPFYRLSHHAKETLAKQSPYRFHDVSSYLNLVRNEAPAILKETEVYLEEAIATYYADCLLACCVMVGVAAEIEFLRMIEAGVKNPAHSAVFNKIAAERSLRQRSPNSRALCHPCRQLSSPVLGKT